MPEAVVFVVSGKKIAPTQKKMHPIVLLYRGAKSGANPSYFKIAHPALF